MLFNSLEFTIFLPVVFCLYWLISYLGKNSRNFFLIVASYFFYGWWDWRFLILIIISSLIDYLVGIGISQAKSKRNKKLLVTTSIVFNLGMLFTVKYYNFFINSFASAFSLFGNPIDYVELNWILPVGISFYTFQTLSYSIDVYREKITPTKDILSFFAFVSFFPQLVAGPIERAKHLLPQFYTKKAFDYSNAVQGCHQMLWGFFKKIVIADNCATYVNTVFTNYEDASGSTLFIAAILFAFQIYGDFSGYSDIAIGTSRLFGFELSKNFAFPYFSRDIAEFWRRWHISLTTWFRDYLYIPLGGSRKKLSVTIRNTFIIFLISGLWHGANWTFVIWGFINAIFFLPLIITKRNRRFTSELHEKIPSINTLVRILATFSITVLAWIFFRSENVNQAFLIIQTIFSLSFFHTPDTIPLSILLMLPPFIVLEWIQKNKEHALDLSTFNLPIIPRWSIYLLVAMLIAWFGGAQQEFIYFQF